MRSRRTLLAVSAQLAILLACQGSAFAQIYCASPADLAQQYGTEDAFEPLAGCYLDRPEARFGTAIFDVLLMNRTDSAFANLVRDPGGTILLDTNDMHMGTEAGVRFQWTCDSDCGTDLQFAYMGSHSFYESTTIVGPDVRGVFYNTFTGNPSTSVTTTYKSDLDSGELNLRTRTWRQLAPLVGVRVLQLEDWIGHDTTTGHLDATADNELYGVQVGFEGVVFRSGRWSLEGTLKAGVYYNNLDVVGDSSNIDFTRWFHQTSFVGDLNLVLRYQICPRIAMRVGYQALWLDNVALLPDQFDNFDVFVTPAQGSVDLSTVGYHGGFVGFEATW